VGADDRCRLATLAYLIDNAPGAAVILSRVAGLRDRVDEALVGILETAGQLHGMTTWFGALNGHIMRMRVADHLVSYTLNLEARSARVVFVERIRQPTSDSNSTEVG